MENINLLLLIISEVSEHDFSVYCGKYSELETLPPSLFCGRILLLFRRSCSHDFKAKGREKNSIAY